MIPPYNLNYELAETNRHQEVFFEKKLLKKLQSNELKEWTSAFADKLSFCHLSGIIEDTLINHLLDFPENSPLAETIRSHLLELVQSENFLKKCVHSDGFVLSHAEQELIQFTDAIKAVVYPSKLIDAKEVPAKLEVNPSFVADPRIMLYNIFAKAGNPQLSVIDDSIEMQLAFTLANAREQFFQKIIPQDEKDRVEVIHYVKNKLQNHLRLIGEQKSVTDEKITNLVYKKPARFYMDYILKGSSDSDKFYYNGRTSYTIPIKKKQGYSNPEVMIEHVYQALKDRSSFQSMLKDRLCGSGGYFDETGTLSRQGVKALLYSTSYLKA